MEKRRFKFVIPVMVVVVIGSIYILNMNDYTEVLTLHKFLITVSATLFSGVIAYFLFPHNDEKRPDDRKPIK